MKIKVKAFGREYSIEDISAAFIDKGVTNILSFNEEVELEEKILNEAERNYLKGVVKPYKVKYIVKNEALYREFIEIVIIDELFGSGCIDFPPFEIGARYKGMITDRHYTLEELGI